VDVNAGELERIVTGLGGYQSDAPALQFGMVTGVMRGFMDLVFEHEGRYYIADYKSNYLGPRRELYGRDALCAAVSANRYDFQYLIYTVALHRYLRRRVPDYDYVRHFGGVYYLFLRGMSPTDPGLGVYFDRPEAVLIETLDNLFAGRRL
jgi:exodeoxyribonuclease V beta subunit